MDCGSCAVTIENAVRKLDGVRGVEVSFPTETLTVQGDVDLDELQGRVSALGYELHEDTRPAVAQTPRGFLQFLRGRSHSMGVMAAGALALALFPFAQTGWAAQVHRWALVVLTLGAGLPVALKGLKALWHGRHVTIDLLMGLAAGGALAIGVGDRLLGGLDPEG